MAFSKKSVTQGLCRLWHTYQSLDQTLGTVYCTASE